MSCTACRSAARRPRRGGGRAVRADCPPAGGRAGPVRAGAAPGRVGGASAALAGDGVCWPWPRWRRCPPARIEAGALRPRG